MEPVGGIRCELQQEQGRAHDADAQEEPEGELALLGCASVAAGYEGCASLRTRHRGPGRRPARAVSRDASQHYVLH